jgi:hypothetical protein
MAEKRAKKPKDLDPKAKGAQVKGGGNILNDADARRKFLRRTVKRAAGGPDAVVNPKN